MDHELIREVLLAVRDAESTGCALDEAALGATIGEGAATVRIACDAVTTSGLAWIPEEGTGITPVLRPAGRQYLDEGPAAFDAVLGFLSPWLDDLNARRAVLEFGRTLLSDFAIALTDGSGKRFATDLVEPWADGAAMTLKDAVLLFEAAVAFISGLDTGRAAATPAEGLIGMRLFVGSPGLTEATRDEFITGLIGSVRAGFAIGAVEWFRPYPLGRDVKLRPPR